MQSYSSVSSGRRNRQVVRSTPLGPWIGYSPGQRERLAKPPPRRFVVAGVSVERPVEAQHLGQVPRKRSFRVDLVCSRMPILRGV